MAKVYVTRCIVKKDGRSYQKGSVMEGLTDKEIKQGLKERWLEAVGNDEEPAEAKPNKPPKDEKPGKSGKEKSGKPEGELIAEAEGEARK
jgi:hypothetical protein